jgi:hypothetical protein
MSKPIYIPGDIVAQQLALAEANKVGLKVALGTDGRIVMLENQTFVYFLQSGPAGEDRTIQAVAEAPPRHRGQRAPSQYGNAIGADRTTRS